MFARDDELELASDSGMLSIKESWTTYIHICARVYVFMYVCMYECMYVFMYVYVCMCVCMF